MRAFATAAPALVRIVLAVAFATAGTTLARAETQTFELTVTERPPGEPARFVVRRGDSVVIALAATIAADVHLHGYNLEAKLAPGARATWNFIARATGRYPINVHKPGETAGHRHAPPIAYLEVRPR